MKLNGTLISVAILLVTLTAPTRSQQQELKGQSIRTSIAVSRQSVLPYESLSVLLLLRNETAKEKRVRASWRSFLSVGAMTPQGTKWRDYLGDNEPLVLPPVATPKDFAPGEVKKQPSHIDYEAPSGEHVFARPGKYILQGTASDDGRFLSDRIEITVRIPESVDRKAYEFLQTSYLHHFFGEYTVLKYRYEGKTVQDMEKFIADFDGSEYSYLARMGLAFMWLHGVEGKQDQPRAIELLTQVAERAGEPLSSAAEYHLGKVLQRQKETAQANSHFQTVLSGTPSPYFRYLTEESLRQH